MSEWKVQDIRNGRGVRIGVGVYHPDYMDVFPTLRNFIRYEYPNGVVRRVWCDNDGRAIMVGWFFKDWNDA